MSKVVSVANHHARHEPAGADEINDIDISNTGVLLSAHKARHIDGGTDDFHAGDLLNATARVNVSKNSGATVGTRRRINLIEGANITLTVADDAGNEEVDVTITSGIAAASGWTKSFFPAVDPTSFKGTYATLVLADAIDTTLYQTFMMPDDLVSLTSASVIIIPSASGNLYWNCTTDFAAPCAAEDYNIHTDSIASGATAVTIDKMTCLDISSALTGAVGGDLVGINFTRLASNVLDTIGNSIHYVGILIRGTT